MNIQRILENNISILVGQTSSGKTMLFANMAAEYSYKYTGNVYCYGLKKEITDQLDVTVFSSVRELEKIQNGIILVDEVGALFDLDNRKQKRMVENTLRLIDHHNNHMVFSGLPPDFKKFLSAKATCFMYMSLTISDLINGSLTKTTLLEYREKELGAYVLSVNKGEVLCYDDGGFWIDKFPYVEKFDTKRSNINLFQKRHV